MLPSHVVEKAESTEVTYRDYSLACPQINIIIHFRLHRMQTIATDNHSVCLSDCLSHGLTLLHCAKMAAWIDILLRVNTPVWGFQVLDRGPASPWRGGGGCGKFLSLWTLYMAEDRLEILYAY